MPAAPGGRRRRRAEPARPPRRQQPQARLRRLRGSQVRAPRIHRADRNEAIHYLREVLKDRLYDRPDDALAGRLGLECLRYMYRLLFLFYIEARPDLGYAPVDSEAYRKGYSLEHLRDLEMVRLTSEESLDGYYLHHSIRTLFALVRDGFDGSHRGGAADLLATGTRPPQPGRLRPQAPPSGLRLQSRAVRPSPTPATIRSSLAAAIAVRPAPAVRPTTPARPATSSGTGYGASPGCGSRFRAGGGLRAGGASSPGPAPPPPRLSHRRPRQRPLPRRLHPAPRPGEAPQPRAPAGDPPDVPHPPTRRRRGPERAGPRAAATRAHLLRPARHQPARRGLRGPALLSRLLRRGRPLRSEEGGRGRRRAQERLVRPGARARRLRGGRTGLRARPAGPPQAPPASAGPLHLPPRGPRPAEVRELLHPGGADPQRGQVRARRVDPGRRARRPHPRPHRMRAGHGLRRVPQRGGEPARGEVPGAQAARDGPAHPARGLRRRAPEGEALHRGPQRVRRGPEPGGGRAGRGLPVAELHPPGRARPLVRLPARLRQLPGGREAAGVPHHRPRPEEPQARPLVQPPAGARRPLGTARSFGAQASRGQRKHCPLGTRASRPHCGP